MEFFGLRVMYYKIWKYKMKFIEIYCDLCIYWVDNNILFDNFREENIFFIILINIWIF